MDRHCDLIRAALSVGSPQPAKEAASKMMEVSAKLVACNNGNLLDGRLSHYCFCEKPCSLGKAIRDMAGATIQYVQVLTDLVNVARWIGPVQCEAFWGYLWAMNKVGPRGWLRPQFSDSMELM